MDFRALLRPALLAGATLAAVAGGLGCQDNPPSPKLQGQVHLTLIHTSDIHSRLFPYNLQLGQIDAGLGLGEAGAIVNVGGAARVSHIVGRERARASRVLHLDGGDCFQGAPVFNYYSGEAEVRALSAMGTDAMIVANHEFDRGALNLGLQLQKWADYPVLAANYMLEDPSQPGASPLGTILKPFTVFDLQGLKVGVVGMGNLSSMTSIFDAPNRLGVTPLNTTEVAQFYVDLLRPMVDVVVLVTHLGLEVDERMIETTSGIDVVLGGHNHIVLQPPKRVRDCKFVEEKTGKHFIALNGDEAVGPGDALCDADADCASNFCFHDPDRPRDDKKGLCKVKRYCEPRDVILAHSGAFAKYVGRLDLVVSNDPKDFGGRARDALDGFEVLTHEYKLFPVNDTVPDDPIVASVLEPYRQGLDAVGNLDLLVGYALDGSKRNATGGGDSPLGNLIATAMWLRLGIQTDFSLTNSTGIRADLVPGPVTVEQMFNIFPFDNAITKMQVSGVEVQELFDFVARRSSGRGCVTQVQIAGARVVFDCKKRHKDEEGQTFFEGLATNIYIGTYDPPKKCQSDADCPGMERCPETVEDPEGKNCSAADLRLGACDIENGICWQPLTRVASYELATSDYLAGGGSGFRVLQRNTTQNNTKVQQRDALIDYIRAGLACGADPKIERIECDSSSDCPANHACDKTRGRCDPRTSCKKDSDCGGVGEGYVCACPESVIEGTACQTDPAKECSAGLCVLARCRDDVAAYQRSVCEAAPNKEARDDCLSSLAPCSAGGEQCKFLACVDRNLGNFSDGRVRMVGQ